jgi:hypothetical protein
MSFTVQVKTTYVIQETAVGQTYPMLLPWERWLTDDVKSHARIGGGTIPPNSTNFQVDFAGITTLTTLWFFPEADMEVTLGSNINQSVPVQAGGCVGFMRAVIPSNDALRIKYTGTEPAAFSVVWAGDA